MKGQLKILFFFFNDTATTEIYTLSLHDALPIWRWIGSSGRACVFEPRRLRRSGCSTDRKSTRLNSSHMSISYAVFCLKKKIRHGDDGTRRGENSAPEVAGRAVGEGLHPRLLEMQLEGVVVGYFFFFNDTATTEIYTLSLHDALPI